MLRPIALVVLLCAGWSQAIMLGCAPASGSRASAAGEVAAGEAHHRHFAVEASGRPAGNQLDRREQRSGPGEGAAGAGRAVHGEHTSRHAGDRAASGAQDVGNPATPATDHHEDTSCARVMVCGSAVPIAARALIVAALPPAQSQGFEPAAASHPAAFLAHEPPPPRPQV